jgi:hypothetical protein
MVQPPVRAREGEQADSIIEAIRKRADVSQLGACAEAGSMDEVETSPGMDQRAAPRCACRGDERVGLNGQPRRLSRRCNGHQSEEAGQSE